MRSLAEADGHDWYHATWPELQDKWIYLSSTQRSFVIRRCQHALKHLDTYKFVDKLSTQELVRHLVCLGYSLLWLFADLSALSLLQQHCSVPCDCSRESRWQLLLKHRRFSRSGRSSRSTTGCMTVRPVRQNMHTFRRVIVLFPPLLEPVLTMSRTAARPRPSHLLSLLSASSFSCSEADASLLSSQHLRQGLTFPFSFSFLLLPAPFSRPTFSRL